MHSCLDYLCDRGSYEVHREYGIMRYSKFPSKLKITAVPWLPDDVDHLDIGSITCGIQGHSGDAEGMSSHHYYYLVNSRVNLFSSKHVT